MSSCLQSGRGRDRDGGWAQACQRPARSADQRTGCSPGGNEARGASPWYRRRRMQQGSQRVDPRRASKIPPPPLPPQRPPRQGSCRYRRGSSFGSQGCSEEGVSEVLQLARERNKTIIISLSLFDPLFLALFIANIAPKQAFLHHKTYGRYDEISVSNP